MPSSASSSDSIQSSVQSAARLPELFGKPTQLLGWQGITAIIPESWNMVSFGGDREKGNFRLADDDGLRLEVLWEKPKGTPDVERSVELLLKNIQRESKKKKNEFSAIENPKLIPRTRKEHADKEQLTNFGWQGDAEQAVGHGFGAAWFCPVSERVVVTHAVGSGAETPEKTRRLAAEVLSSFQSHGVGGWQTWSVFGLQVEMPEEFSLASAKLQTGRIELDWERTAPNASMNFLSPAQWGKRVERVGLRRLSAANVILENESLEAWAARVAAPMWKKFRFGKFEETTAFGHSAFSARGRLKDPRQTAFTWLFDRVLRRHTPPPELTVWREESDNKIFVFLCDLWPVNASIKNDILDSLQSRTF